MENNRCAGLGTSMANCQCFDNIRHYRIMLLAMLMATAVLLGLVTWLGQKYEEEISVT